MTIVSTACTSKERIIELRHDERFYSRAQQVHIVSINLIKIVDFVTLKLICVAEFRMSNNVRYS
jgi:uncharacterized membrane protein YiaA